MTSSGQTYRGCQTGSRMQGAGCRVQGAGCWMQGAGCRVPGAGCRVQGAGCWVQGARFRGQDAGCTVHGIGCRMQDARCKVQDAGCRVRVHGAVCRVQSAGCPNPLISKISRWTLYSFGNAIWSKSQNNVTKYWSLSLLEEDKGVNRKGSGYVAKQYIESLSLISQDKDWFA